ncbi:transketolase [Bosea sp. WAO]|uniref:transketolase n=1 Tax=Bosea sp. WAO TaxID=406341 RepID=UPI000835D807|nr:transketolase [Bosea sp. WAO]
MSLQIKVPATLADLAEAARINRIDTMDMFAAAGNGHYGSCFSCAEIVTALYFNVMRLDPARPDWPERDRFVLGKGHAAPTLYSALIRRGYMPEHWIHEFEAKVGVKLMTHPSRRYQPGVDASGGALGHGLSIGVGMALAGKIDRRDYRSFVLLGDGEIQEGSVWEAFASAAKYRLGHLVAIIDANGLSVDGTLDEVMPMEPLADKLSAFGWEVVECDGHDLAALLRVLDIGHDRVDAAPRAIIARTVKGRGVSFMENVRRWHADVLTPDEDRLARAELTRPLS